MRGRAKDFFSKFLFCIQVSGSIRTLFALVLNSKRFSNFCNSEQLITQDKAELPKRYLLKLTKNRRNVFLRTYSGDIGIFYEVFWRRVYSVTHLDWKNFKCVIDLGANVGMTALFFRAVAPKAKIIAFEPDPDNFHLLRKNTENEIRSGNLVTIHAAVSDTNGILSFEKSRLAYNTKVIDDNNGAKVKSISLNTLIRDHSIEQVDLVKIDIEGFEHRLFSRNTKWLDLVRNIIIEIHSQENFDIFKSQMDKCGFFIKRLSKEKQTGGVYLASRIPL
jgi:FkbM family methyltransferase